MSTPVTTKRSKVIYVEILRIIAIVFVVFHHTNYQGYVRFTTYGAGSFPYWICMVFSVLAGISVPLFFMISGMLLLGKEDETIGYVWKKRIPRYLIVLLLFSLWRCHVLVLICIHRVPHTAAVLTQDRERLHLQGVLSDACDSGCL